MTDEDVFESFTVGDAVHVSHTSGFSGWKAVGRIIRRTAHQITVAIPMNRQPVTIRKRSREWRVRRATNEDLAYEAAEDSWNRVWDFVEKIPVRPLGGTQHRRWVPPKFRPDVLDLILRAADAYMAAATQPVGDNDGSGKK